MRTSIIVVALPTVMPTSTTCLGRIVGVSGALHAAESANDATSGCYSGLWVATVSLQAATASLGDTIQQPGPMMDSLDQMMDGPPNDAGVGEV
ncbi:hypothetical protein ACLOJK_022961 [Asimina triloba]